MKIIELLSTFNQTTAPTGAKDFKMNFFKTEIKLNPSYKASNRIEVSARRYIGRDSRWYAELQDGFHSYEPVEWVQGDLKIIKAFIAKWQESHKAS